VTTNEFDQPAEERRQLGRPKAGEQTLGMSVYDIADVARQLGAEDYVGEEAVIVTDVDLDGLAAEEGIRPGTRILQVRDTPTKSVAEFQKAVRKESLERGVLLLVRDPEQPGSRFVVLKSRE
jgi:S1-C subfamily serine protease